MLLSITSSYTTCLISLTLKLFTNYLTILVSGCWLSIMHYATVHLFLLPSSSSLEKTGEILVSLVVRFDLRYAYIFKKAYYTV